MNDENLVRHLLSRRASTFPPTSPPVEILVRDGRRYQRRRRTLLVLASAVSCLALVGLAISFDWTQDDESGVASSAGPIAVPVSSWTSGEDAMLAELSGVLRGDSSGCIYVDGRQGQGQLVVWPKGFSAQLKGDQVEVLDAEGVVVAKTGSAINAGGGSISAGDVNGGNLRDCVTDSSDVFVIQSAVEAGPAG